MARRNPDAAALRKPGVRGCDVATPWDNSGCLVISLANGPTYGRCCHWDHDEAYDLVPIGDSFAAAVAALQSGFISGDATVRKFIGIH